MRFVSRALGLLALLLLMLIFSGVVYRVHRPIVASSPAPIQFAAITTNNIASSATKSDEESHQRLKQLRRTFLADIKVTGAPGSPDAMIELEGQRIYTASGPALTLRDDPRKSGPYFVQFKGPVQPAWKKRIESLGGIIHGYIPNNAYSVDLTPGLAKRLSQESFVRWIHPVEPQHKIQPFLGSLVAAKSEDVPDIIPVTINTFTPQDAFVIAKKLADLSITPEAMNSGKRWGWVRAEVPRNQITAIASIDRVQWIEEYVAPELFNDKAVNGARMNVTNVWTARGLTGAGQVIGHADTGLDLGSFSLMHPDFTNRLLAAYALGRPSTWNDPQGHGTHTAGSIFGNGTMSTGQFRGVAWQATLVHQSLLDSSGGLGGIPDDLNTLYMQAYTNGARVHSDSWGSSVFGSYTTSSRESDEFMWDHPDMLLVFAVGNDGADSGDGVVDLDSIGSPATAKNMLSVGAAESDRAPGSGGFSSASYGSKWFFDYPVAPINGDLISQSASITNQGIAAFSSRGPTDDGRIKPDVVAPGTDVVSVKSRAAGAGSGWGLNANNNYNFNGGTSMSTPLVAGAAALVRQYFQQYRDHEQPSAALIKGAMMHGARSLSPGQYGIGATREIPATVPNPVEGWGQVDIEGSLFPSDVSWFYSDQTNGLVAPGDTDEVIFYAETGSVRVTLNYSDFPATAGGGKKLVNDLDVSLSGPGGVGANSGSDRTNPAERISYSIPVSGIYTARVEAFNVPSGPQPYALIVSGPVVDKPVITVSLVNNTFVTNQPYAVTARVSSAVALATNAVSLFWREASGPVEFEHVEMTHVTNDVYTGFIPAHGNPSALRYYVAASSSVFAVTSPANAPASFYGFWVTDAFTLTVSGIPAPVFNVSPDYGSHLFAAGNINSLWAPAYSNITAGMRVANAGWIGSGDVPSSGVGNEVHVMFSQDSSISWVWITQYALTHTSTIAGIINSTTWWSDWVPASTITAATEVTWLGTNVGFAGWTVDGQRQPDNTSVAANPATTIFMYGPRTAVGVYIPTSLDGNTNGLPDWWEQFFFGTNSAATSDDIDEDGFTNQKEYADRTNPRDAGSFPQAPTIDHVPLDDPQTSPAPWKIEATIEDNFAVSNATVYWQINGDTWTSAVLVDSALTNFSGQIAAPGTNSDVFAYRIEATDMAGFTATNGPHVFTVQYPLMSAGPLSFGEIGLPSDTTSNVVITITNRGLASLLWTLDRALMFDHVESGIGTWTHAGVNDVWNINNGRFYSANHAWHLGAGPSGTYPDSAHAWLDMEPITLDAAAKLVFMHWAKMEYDAGQNDDHYWDGAVVEVSTNGGVDFVMINPVGGYPHRITANDASPFPPETPCYGETVNWEMAEFDLSFFAGETVTIRFRFGSDAFVVDEGWYIDDVRIQYQNDTSWDWLDVETNGVVEMLQASNAVVQLDSTPLKIAERRHAVLVLTGNDPELTAPIVIPISLHNISREVFVTASDNGSVTPMGSVLVNEGGSTSFWMMADTFYEIGEIQTNGVPVTDLVLVDATNFVLSSVMSNETLHVVFMEKMAAGLVPEWWLYQEGLTNQTPAQEAVTDHDGDGMLSWQEYRAVTDPNDPESVTMPVVEVMPLVGSVLVEWLSFTNPATLYDVHRATNLLEGFFPVATNLPATPPVNVFTNPGSAAEFEVYRVRAVP